MAAPPPPDAVPGAPVTAPHQEEGAPPVIEWNDDKTVHDFAFFRQQPSVAQIQAFERFSKKVTGLGVFGMAREYIDNVKTYQNHTRAAFDENTGKNRYKDVPCADATRVVLPDNGYIHANYVKGAPLYLPFILCQGPLAATIGDFWSMVDQCKVTHIVMLCDNVEMGRVKCEPYVPQKPGDELDVPGGYRITFSEKEGRPEVTRERTTITTKFLMYTPSGAVKKIRHYHYKVWPDKATPPVQDMLGLLRILQKVRTNSADQHTVVHCSAGIGRTGTLVAIEMCLHQLLGEPAKELNLVEIGTKLRDQRPGSIQVEMQYLMVGVVVMEYGRLLGFIKDKELLAEIKKFNIDYDKLTSGEDLDPPPQQRQGRASSGPAPFAPTAVPSDQAPSYNEPSSPGKGPVPAPSNATDPRNRPSQMAPVPGVPPAAVPILRTAPSSMPVPQMVPSGAAASGVPQPPVPFPQMAPGAPPVNVPIGASRPINTAAPPTLVAQAALPPPGTSRLPGAQTGFSAPQKLVPSQMTPPGVPKPMPVPPRPAAVPPPVNNAAFNSQKLLDVNFAGFNAAAVLSPYGVGFSVMGMGVAPPVGNPECPGAIFCTIPFCRHM